MTNPTQLNQCQAVQTTFKRRACQNLSCDEGNPAQTFRISVKATQCRQCFASSEHLVILIQDNVMIILREV